MGCLFGSALHTAGIPTTLLLRQASAAPTARVQVERDGKSQQFEVPVGVATAGATISHLLVTTKAYDVRQAVLDVSPRLGRDCQVLLLANGMGFAEQLAAELPDLAFYHGTTTEGAYRIGPRHIRHAGRGLTRIGRPGTAEPPAWFSQWQQALPASQWDTDITRSLWFKLAINCAINPLTAVNACRNGELARRPELAATVAALCDEIVAISTAAGNAGVAAGLHTEVARVIAATADNRSSMLQDVLAGRRTENDFITGHLLTVARRHGLAAPHNAALFAQIAAIDHSHLPGLNHR